MEARPQDGPLLLARLPPLGAARPHQHLAGSARADPGGLLKRGGDRALGSQTAHCVPRTSCRRRGSRVRSPTRRFSAAFARSRARRRPTSATSRPPHWRRHRSRVGSAIVCWRQLSRPFPRASASCQIRMLGSAVTRLRCRRPPVAMRSKPRRSTGRMIRGQVTFYRSSRKNARRSAAKAAGSSRAAKWPPAAIGVHRWRLYTPSAQVRGGRTISRGKAA
jgi:hypothetical protein